MSTHASYAELLKMPIEDLERDIREQNLTVRKLRMGITMMKEKDTAQLKRERRMLARMMTALGQRSTEQLKTPKKTSTVPAPSKKPAAAKAPRKKKATPAA